MNTFVGPTGRVAPGTRRPFGPTGGAFNPWSVFRPSDLNKCYPRQAWISRRLRDYPQAPRGNALRDPLPVPFTRDEVTQALYDVWRASHQPIERACAQVSAASVQIALSVLPILQSRNGGWIDFDATRPAYDPLVATPGSTRGQAANLQCVLYRLVGKPLPPIYDRCRWTPPAPHLIYNIRDVQTTYDPAAQQSVPAPSPLRPVHSAAPYVVRPGAPSGGLLGHELEAAPEPAPEPFSHSLFTIYKTFGIKGE